MRQMKKQIILFSLILVSSFSFGQSLSLEQVKQLALENNFKVKNSRLEIESAKQIKKDASTKYFPQVSAILLGMKAIDPLMEMKMEGGNLPVYDGNPTNLANATQFAYMPGVDIGLFNQMATGAVNLQQPIYVGGKINTGNRLADLNIKVKESEEVLAKNNVLLNTEQQYWLVISLQEKQKTLNDYMRLLDGLHHQVSNAYRNGLILKNDLLKVTIKQSELKVNMTQLENGKKLAMKQLCQTIGIEYAEDLALQDDLSFLEEPSNYQITHSLALATRPEYYLFEDGLKASELQTEMTKADYRPSVGIGLSGYYLDQLESNVNGSFNGMVYASISIPISDLWNKKHKLKDLKHKEEIAKNNLQDGKGLLNLQMEKAWVDLTEAHQKIKLIEETLEQTIENVKVNQNSYNNGVIQLSDLLEAHALQTETEDKLIEAKSFYKVAITYYLQTTGR